MSDFVPTWLSSLGALSMRNAYDPVTQLRTYRVRMRDGGEVVCHVDDALTNVRGELTAAICRYQEGKPSDDADSPTPEIDGEVIGFRSWALYAWKLGIAGKTSAPPWQPGVNTARCHALAQRLGPSGHSTSPPFADRHDAPDEDCDCGLYALRQPDKQWTGMGSEHWREIRVCGAVLAWGDRFFLHPTGFRAQYAKPVVLATSEQWPRPMRAMIAALAQDYACDVVRLEYLRDAAREHGQLVPPNLVPQADETGTASELAARTGGAAWRIASTNPTPAHPRTVAFPDCL